MEEQSPAKETKQIIIRPPLKQEMKLLRRTFHELIGWSSCDIMEPKAICVVMEINFYWN